MATKSVRRSRASSPLLGSYTVAALACNWKVVVVLLTSKKTGVYLVAATTSVFPGPTQSLFYPFVFAIAFSLLYPSLKAVIATFNTGARIMELRSEYRMGEWKERVAAKQGDVESVIGALVDLANRDKIGYHDLKRIHDVLPKPDELQIRQS
ncbi:hypothetical protein [Lysobacter hankyongensis]